MLKKLWAEQTAAKAIASMDMTGQQVTTPTFVPPKELKKIKMPFFENLASVLVKLQNPEKIEKLSRKCWKEGLFEQCFDVSFQQESNKLVRLDTIGIYFGTSGDWEDPSLEHCRKIFKVADDHFEMICDQHDVSFTSEVAAKTPNKELVGRKVLAIGGPGGWFPGYVQQFKMLKNSKEEFTVCYVNPDHPEGRAKRVEKVNREKLLKMLMCNDPDSDEEDNDSSDESPSI